MKIKKIEDRIEPKGQFDVELQDCLHDCTEYFLKTKQDYEKIAGQGYTADGSASLEEIREIKEIFGFYCYKKPTVKTSIYH